MDGNFTGFGAEGVSFYTDNISNIEQLENPVRFLSDIVSFDVDLDFSFLVQNVKERSLSHFSDSHDPAGNRYRFRFLLLVTIYN